METNTGQFKKKYRINEAFFSEYNLASCYYAGFLASDGCVKNDRVVSITQSCDKKKYLDRFKDYVDYTGPLLGPYKTKGRDTYSFTVTCCQWVNDLYDNFKITKKKSLTLKAPNIDNIDMRLSFIAGLIDGDGSVGVYKNGKKKKLSPIITWSGTKDILEWVKDNIDALVPRMRKARKTACVNKIGSTNCFSFRLGGPRTMRFYNKIRNIDIPKMELKWDRLEAVFAKNGIEYYEKDGQNDRARNKLGRFV
jgi:hypothetical protein